MKKSKPIRMCIICKNRQNQCELNRFQILQNDVNFTFQNGRTMYLCDDCLTKNDKDFYKSLQKNIKSNIDKQLLANKLKERFLNGECKN